MDWIRVRHDAPSTVHSADPNEQARTLSFNDVEFNVLERRKDDDGTGLLVFEMKNADAAVVNALRRIMIAEVESVAIDTIGLADNTSIIQDEILAHRVGLVPFNIDPEMLKEAGVDSVYFELLKQCVDGETDNVVLSSDLRPQDDKNVELKALYEAKGLPFPGPIHGDIPLAKLLPGQRVWFVAQLRIGVGKEHAKFSPVATASFRLMPRIGINQEAIGDRAEAIQACCPKKVFDIEDSGHLVAARPLDCTMCRECTRPDGWGDVVTLERDRHHFIVSIESVGMIDAAEIFRRACRVLRDKAVQLQAAIQAASSPASA